jgi:hypothetical protein
VNEAAQVKPDLTFSALVSVRNERVAQDNKWGTQRHTWPEWLVILGEEYGEVCAAVCEHRWGTPLSYEDWQEKRDGIRHELVQLAAVAVAIIEHIDDEPDEPTEADAVRAYEDAMSERADDAWKR